MSADTKLSYVGALIGASRLTEAEKWIVKWQLGLLGDFQTALAGAITRADDNNLMALSLGFPEQVAGFRAWQQGGLAEKLRRMGLEL